MKFVFVFLFICVESFALSKAELEELFNEFSVLYSEQLQIEYDAELKFNPAPKGFTRDYWWTIDHPSARFVFIDSVSLRQINIFIFGGLARVESMTKDAMAISICHELGHLLSEGPKKYNGTTVEGMSDYFSVGDCLRKYFKVIENHSAWTSSPKEIQLCRENFYEELKFRDCLRAFRALLGQYNFLKKEDPTLGFWDRSNIQAKEINREDYYYPEPRCRLETLRNGILQLPPPPCWMPDRI